MKNTYVTKAFSAYSIQLYVKYERECSFYLMDQVVLFRLSTLVYQEILWSQQVLVARKIRMVRDLLAILYSRQLREALHRHPVVIQT